MDKALDPVIECPLVYPGEAESAKGYAVRAETAAERAEKVVGGQGSLQGLVDAAAASATAAAGSATAASDSETASKNSAEAAAGSKTDAENAAERAAESAAAAKQSAEEANTGKKTVADNVKKVTDSAAAALNSENAAAASAKAADQSAKAAAASKEAAAASAQQAAGSAAAAGSSAEAAAGSAEQASGCAEAAESSANAASDSATAAQSSAEAAQNSAAAAKNSETAAAKSAADAREIKDSMPADYTTMSGDVDTLKNQMQRAYPDDSTIGENPWSSKHIIDMLCPPLKESGNPVVCYPVVGYPLGVKASWEPVQEGSGTPSPENIRPIKGRDSVTVERCGENLFNKDGVSVGAPVYGSDGVLSSYKDVAVSYAKVVPGAQYSIRFRQTDSTTLYIRIAFLTKSKKFIKREYMLTSYSGIETERTFTVSADCEWIQFGLNNGITFNYNFDVVFVAGSAPTTYIPYTGQTNTLTLPETVYEGELDAVSGEGQETWKILTLDGTTNKFTQSDRLWKIPQNSAPGVVDTYATIYSHFPANTFGGNQIGSYIFTTTNIMSDYFPDVNALNDYLAAQYAAGTPVKVCYKLAEPVPFTATGAQPIPAIAGMNTVLTDADSATVTGRADPIKRIEDLEAAVASIN